jgi:Xaa-Pro aminopeptidase
MAFTIEPGIYVRPAALENLPDTPANRAFKEKVAPAVERYKNIGVRVEDSYLLTATELVMLSKKVPRTVSDVEAVLKR